MRFTTERLFADHGIAFDVAAELWNFETIKQFVRTGGGIAIVPASVAHPDLETGSLQTVPVEGLDITRSIEVVYCEKGALLPAPAELLGLLHRWRWNGDSQISPAFPVRVATLSPRPAARPVRIGPAAELPAVQADD
jgi:DNA-binding transcriptional LysR family regulator